MYSPNCTFIHFVHSTLQAQHILPTQAGQTVHYIVVYPSLETGLTGVWKWGQLNIATVCVQCLLSLEIETVEIRNLMV